MSVWETMLYVGQVAVIFALALAGVGVLTFLITGAVIDAVERRRKR